ncbi:MAG: hypothetical protein OHK0024_04700 [Thalassobaculales bacterium]
MRHLYRLAAGLSAALLSACSLSTGFRPGIAADLPPDAPVIVALSEARVRPAVGAHLAFWPRSSDVLRSLADQPGLVGYGVRIEPFGTRAWTMTVWQDEASLAGFVKGAAHGRAVAEGLPALADARFARLRTRRGDTPLSWEEAIDRLARDGRPYYE